MLDRDAALAHPMIDEVYHITDHAVLVAKAPATHAEHLAQIAEYVYRRLNWITFEKTEAKTFAKFGGKMAFYTGILPICQGEAGVAVVMSHEIAHAVKRHGNQRISQNLLLKGLLTAGAIAFGSDDPKHQERNQALLAALGLGAQYGIQLPFSRSHESEADAYGVELLIKAGYPPYESVKLWERMAQRGSRVPEFLSTHPNPANRAQALRELIPRLQAKGRAP